MRILMLIAVGAILVIVLAGVSGLTFLKFGAGGFSARAEPSTFEVTVARTARALALPAGAKQQINPIGNSNEVLDEAMAHWADHCAVCHGNDGSGQIGMGRQMYPPAPDMRKNQTQQLTDGELFYIIENGIRLSGMPAWGGTEAGVKDSWKLVHFIRHLPHLSARDLAEMEKLNPKGPEDRELEQQEEQFLNGRNPPETSHHHEH
jgi:mono/diheme cytochrome c family protein